MGALKITIQGHQRGVLYRDGVALRWLEPGRHSFWAWSAQFQVSLIDMNEAYTAYTPELAALMPEGAGAELTVKANQRAILTVDGRPAHFLEPGRYILWTLRAEVRPWLFDVDVLRADISDHFAALVPSQYLKEFTIREHQRALLICDGKVVSFLEPGRHAIWEIERLVEVLILDLEACFAPALPEQLAVMPTSSHARLDVPDGHVAIVYKEGKPFSCVMPGQYILWQLRHKITAKVYATSPLMTEIPEAAWHLVPASLMVVRVIHPYERGLLYVDGKLEGVLEAGRYGIHCDRRAVEVFMVDMREQELQIAGQEVMTSDKVTLRMNLVVKYRVRDALLSVESQTNLHNALYSEAQMAARRYIAGVNVDALLESRNEASQVMAAQLMPRTMSWGVEILQIDLKDVILPGEMKQLLNQVIEAEKKAQAHGIMRREETASTRSQVNTAKMLENNPTLMRLKELEAIKDIVTSIPNLTVVASPQEMLDKLKLLK